MAGGTSDARQAAARGRRRTCGRRRPRRSRRAVAGSPRRSGEIDVLVNCAGIFEEAPIAETSEALWDRTIAVNLTAAWTLSRALLAGLAPAARRDRQCRFRRGAARLCRLRRLLRIEGRAHRPDPGAGRRAGAGCARHRGLPRTGRDRHDAEAVAAAPDPAAERRTGRSRPCSAASPARTRSPKPSPSPLAARQLHDRQCPRHRWRRDCRPPCRLAMQR